MNLTEEFRPGCHTPANTAPSACGPLLEDPEVIRAVQEYLAALKAGSKPDRQALLAGFPEIAAALAECLDGLELVQQAAPHLQPARAEHPAAPEASAEMHLGGLLGDYRILREVGRGGMGIVYEAEQISLGRRVALKLLPLAAGLDAKQLQRFKNEAHAAAQLHHTNIVPVISVGCARGVHYYAMQFIDGQSLAALIGELRRLAEDRGSRIEDRGSEGTAAEQGEEAGSPALAAASTLHPLEATLPAPSSILDPRSSIFFWTVANLGLQAAEALAHAHQQGVVHRDVKPDNLLVDVRGNLWITDFGLARLQGEAGLTLTGELVGTPRYMSPEQASGKGRLVDQRTDIYSLGATLYELLTLEPTFAGRDRQELLRAITSAEPRPPRRLNRAIPADLETICLKALAKEPDRRYQTAGELAEDLRRFLAGQPIQARPVGLVERLWRWCRRNPAPAAASGLAVVAFAAVVALAVGSVFAMHLKQEQEHTQAALHEAARQRDRAEEQQGIAQRQQARVEHQEALARHYLYGAQMNLAQRAWESNHVGLLLDFLERHRPRRAADPDLRGFEWHYLWRRSHDELLTLPGHSEEVPSVAYSPDGKRLAAASGTWDARRQEYVAGEVKIWDATTGQEVLTLKGHTGQVNGVTFSPDGKQLASGSADQAVKVWDATSREAKPARPAAPKE